MPFVIKYQSNNFLMAKLKEQKFYLHREKKNQARRQIKIDLFYMKHTHNLLHTSQINLAKNHVSIHFRQPQNK